MAIADDLLDSLDTRMTAAVDGYAHTPEIRDGLWTVVANSVTEQAWVPPSGGASGQVLQKTAATDYAWAWVTLAGDGLPDGGTAFQALVKASGTDYDADWEQRIPPVAERGSSGGAISTSGPAALDLTTSINMPTGYVYDGTDESIEVPEAGTYEVIAEVSATGAGTPNGPSGVVVRIQSSVDATFADVTLSARTIYVADVGFGGSVTISRRLDLAESAGVRITAEVTSGLTDVDVQAATLRVMRCS